MALNRQRMSWGVQDGTPLMVEALIHDSEECGFGAMGTMCVGSMGTGKTTIMIEMMQRMSYLDSDRIPKQDYLKVYARRTKMSDEMFQAGYNKFEIQDALPKFPCNEVPETVLYAGRTFDYWHNFLEKRTWPDYANPKPVVLHLPKDEELHFVVPFSGELRELILDGIVKYYSSPKEVIRNMQQGAINVFYPSSEFQFSDEILENFRRKNLKDEILEQRDLRWMNFELVWDLMQTGYKKHVTWFADEIHALLPPQARELEWHILDWYFREIAPELRRCHISSLGTTHSCTLVDPRHMRRVDWFLWTGGAVPNKQYSMLQPAPVLKCRAGHCIIERKGQKFGGFDYPRLPNQLPKLRTVYGPIEKSVLK